jgi:hypothetical protein
MSTPRSRSRSDAGTPLLKQEWSNGILYDSGYTQNASFSEEMLDFVVPDFFKRQKEGEIFNNPCTYTKDLVHSTNGGTYVATKGSNKDEINGPGCLSEYIVTHYPQYSPGVLPVPILPDLTVRARAQALSFMDRTPYSFAEDVFELRETLRFLKQPFKAARDLSRLFKKDVKTFYNRRRARTLAEATAKAWLEYRFAFSPLLRSCIDIIEAYQSTTNIPPRKIARGEVKVDDVSTHTSIHGPFTWERETSLEKTYRSGILYEISNPITDWRYKYGLRIKDIPETIWAVVPYSFMVDRFVNLSGAIRGITNFLDPSLKILAAWDVTKSTATAVRRFTEQNSSGWSIVVTPDDFTEFSISYVRSPWSPSIEDNIPSLNMKGLVDDSTKIADLASLIVSNLKGR